MGVFVGPEGAPESSIALVGEAPSFMEEREGRPFCGPAGHLLELCLVSAKLPRPALYITNFLKERPRDDDLRPWCGPVSRAKANELRAAGCLVHEVVKSWDEAGRTDYYALTPLGMEARERLLEEVNALDAKVIVAMGNSALMALTGKSEILKMRGSPMLSEDLPGKIILPTIHTAASLRGSYLFRYYIQADLQKAKEMARPGFALPERRFILEAGFEETVETLRRYRKEPSLGFDIETKWKEPVVLAVGFAPSPGEGISIPFLRSWTTAEERLLRQEIAEVLASEGELVTQNGIFDTFIMEWAWRHRVERRLQDTMIAHRVLYPELLSGLDTLASLYTYEPFYKADGKESRRVGDTRRFLEYNAKDAAVTKEVWDTLGPMIANDPSYAKTYRFVMDLHAPLKKMMHKGFRTNPGAVAAARVEAIKSLRTMQKELDEAVRPVLEKAAAPLQAQLAEAEAEMERLGEQRQKVSAKTGKPLKGMEYVHPIEARREASKKVTALKKELSFFEPELDEELGLPVLMNVNSQPKLIWYFYTRTGIPPYIDRKSKAPTTDELAMQRLAKPATNRPAAYRSFPEAQLVLDIRGARKMVSTYLNMVMDPDNRCRCAYKPLGARTGRLSSTQTYWETGGNHQNIPQEFRSVFIPDPGHFLWAIDKKGAEWVVVAYASGDANMIKCIEEGIDPHTHTAHLMTGLPYEVIDAEAAVLGSTTNPIRIKTMREALDPAVKHALENAAWIPVNMSCRQAGKKANHGLNYNEGYMTFALTNGFSAEDAKKIIALYTTQAYPGVPRWWNDIQLQLQSTRTMENCFGRKWVFRGALNDELFRVAYAFIPQSTIVDASNQGLLHAYWNLPKMDLLLQKHDEVLGQFAFAHGVETFEKNVMSLASAMTPKMEYGGREFTVGNELALGMSWGTLREVHLEPAAIQGAFLRLKEEGRVA